MELRVGPYVYPIRFDKDQINADSVALRGELDGVFDSAECYIAINPDLAKQRQRVVLVHEMLHAICYVAALHPFPKGLTEEGFALRTEAVFAQVIRDNPDVLAFLTGSD